MLDYEKAYEKEQFAKMSRKEKIEHIWTYYKLPIILGLLALFVIGWCVNHYILNPPAKIGFRVVTYAPHSSYDKAEELSAKYQELFADRLGEERALLQSLQDYSGNEMYYEEAMASVTQITALVSAVELDVLMSGEAPIFTFSLGSFFVPLDRFFGAEEFGRLQAALREKAGREDVVLYAPLDEKTPDELYPIAFLLVGCEDELSLLGPGDNYAAVIANAPAPEIAKEYLRYLICGEEP